MQRPDPVPGPREAVQPALQRRRELRVAAVAVGDEGVEGLAGRWRAAAHQPCKPGPYPRTYQARPHFGARFAPWGCSGDRHCAACVAVAGHASRASPSGSTSAPACARAPALLACRPVDRSRGPCAAQLAPHSFAKGGRVPGRDAARSPRLPRQSPCSAVSTLYSARLTLYGGPHPFGCHGPARRSALPEV